MRPQPLLIRTSTLMAVGWGLMIGNMLYICISPALLPVVVFSAFERSFFQWLVIGIIWFIGKRNL